jgi:thiol-disulfide isomerase/thioredoxin
MSGTSMRTLLGALLGVLLGCSKPAPEASPKPVPPAAKLATPAAVAVAVVKATPGDGPLAPYISAAVGRAANEGARTIVYVGATWCDPCRRFKDSLAQGKLNGALRGIRFLEFDKDKHGDQLDAAGYQSQYIPLFAVPADDGRHSGKHIEGSINGPGATGNIVPRLMKLLQETAD